MNSNALDLLNIDNLPKNPGLINGQTGFIIYLFLYEKYSENNEAIGDFAYSLLEHLISNIHNVKSVNYADGIAGIGSGISFLIQNSFVEASENEILEDVDKVLFQYIYNNIHTDLSLKTGLLGIGQYFLNRLNAKTIEEDRISQLNSKMNLLLILDILLARFHLNGYTYPLKTSGTLTLKEINDIELFLFYLKENTLCNELVDRLLVKINDSYKNRVFSSPDLIKRATYYRDYKRFSSEVTKIMAKEDKENILYHFASITRRNTYFYSAWNLFD